MRKSNGQPQLVYETEFGRAFRGDARRLLGQRSTHIKPGSVDLIFTSPPFALTRPKDYGNKSQDTYLEWFATFLPAFKRALSPTGSLVVDVGGSWLPGAPRRSTYHFALALEIEKQLELCQEFYWYNPAKLPGPAEWVNRRRLRVKDSVNLILWYAKDAAKAKAHNREVQRRYSESMQSLLKSGYQVRRRPSNHEISAKFLANNGGAIPSNLVGFPWPDSNHASDLEGEPFEQSIDNLVAISNTSSTDRYLRMCKERGLKPHGARFPLGLPSFFILLLTDKGDLVCDPFAGSNTTGEAAQAAERHWVSIDLDAEGDFAGTYVLTSSFRFPDARFARGQGKFPLPNWESPAQQVRPTA